MNKPMKGELILPSGKQIEFEGEIDIEEAKLDDEKARQHARQFFEAIRAIQGRSFVFRNIFGEYGTGYGHSDQDMDDSSEAILRAVKATHVPTGPVVDSTLAEKVEERQ